MKPLEFAAALREAADVVERMPEVKCSAGASVMIFCDTADEFRGVARAIGTFEKTGDEHTYEIIRRLGKEVRILAQISRGKICKKVRVVKEVDEYQCEDSLLEPASSMGESQ